jgi:hypothetical protein
MSPQVVKIVSFAVQVKTAVSIQVHQSNVTPENPVFLKGAYRVASWEASW